MGASFLAAFIFLIQSSQLLVPTDHWTANGGGTHNDNSRVLLETYPRPRAIFYNIYILNAEKKFRAMSIVKEQLAEQQKSQILASAELFYTVIGYNATDEIQEECGKNCHLLQFAEQGDEGLTIQALFDYCLDHPDSLVSYLHDKGSLHPTPKNRHFRTMLTKAVFSDACQMIGKSNDDDDKWCNICGARFSPFPHMHMAGNMWTAPCSYIQRLIPPNQFGEKMEHLMDAVMQRAKVPTVPKPTFQQYQDEYFVGRNRFAMEHWLGSHPSVIPCDVYPGDYLCGYMDLPKSTDSWIPALKQAPRFPVSVFAKRAAQGSWFCGQARLLEFQFLYGERPPANSFVWSFYSEAFKTCLEPLNRLEHEHLFANLSSIIMH